MSETTTIVMSIVGATISIIGVSGLMLRLPATSIAREFNSTNKRIDDLKADLNSRIDGTNGRIDDLKADLNGRFDETNKRFDETNKRFDETNKRFDETNRRSDTLSSEMHQRFDQVSRELGENRERMAKLEGSLDGFLAGRRDRDAA